MTVLGIPGLLFLLFFSLSSLSLAIQQPAASLPAEQNSSRQFESTLLAQAALYADRDPKCPPCFNCLLSDYKCRNFGQCSADSGRCSCPEGFGGDDCREPLCGSLPEGIRRNVRSPEDKQCSCTSGWFGDTCNVCHQDNACAALINPRGTLETNGTCYKGGQPVKNMFSTCAVVNKYIQRYPENQDKNVTIQCNREQDFCRFEFWMDHKITFSCLMNQCNFVQVLDNGQVSTTGTCNKVKCSCIPNTYLCDPENIDLTDLFESSDIRGPGILSCKEYGFDNGRYNCEFDEPGLRKNLGPLLGPNPVIELGCRFGECLNPSDIPGYQQPEKKLDIVLLFTIGGITLCGFVLIFSMAYAYLNKLQKNQRYMALEDSESHDNEGLVALMEPGHHVPATLTFRNLCYEIETAGERRRVLKGIHGIVKPGQCMAIMGASGAGKTSCLDILAGKTKRGNVIGEIFINGEVPTRKQFKRISGYVDQEDTLMGTLTVYETLLYSAMLRLPRNMSRADKERRVRETMMELGIEHIADTMIGVPGRRGISGGEKRRVSIAMEVVTSPSILFLDEPTSGLDSFNALSVVQSLVTLAKKYNRTIIMTIHQPRSNIFAMFDRLLLLAEGGYMVYSGPISKMADNEPQTSKSGMDSPKDNIFAKVSVLENWLNDIGVPCPRGFNLADYLIDLTKTGGPDFSTDLTHMESYDDPSFSKMRHRKTNASNLSQTPSPRRTAPKTPTTDFIIMDPFDMQELNLQRHHLQYIVYGFLRSNVCRELKEDITESLSGQDPLNTSTLTAGKPGSPVIGNENDVHDSTAPLLRRPTSLNAPFGGDEDDSAEELSGTTANAASSNIVGNMLQSVIALGSPPSGLRPTFWTQFYILSGRALTNFYRNPLLMWAHYGISIAVALICGGLYFQVSDDLPGFQNRMGVLLFMFCIFGFGSLSSLELFAQERTLFMRERANGYYGVGVYYLTKILFDMIPLRVIPPLLLGCICYYMIGFVPDAIHFLKFLLVLVLFNMTTAAICFVIAAACGGHFGVANLIGVMCMLFSMLFSGFLLNKDKMPVYAAWLKYLSCFNYAFEASLANEVSGLTLNDKKLGLTIQIPGTLILDTFGFNGMAYWPDVIALTWMFLGLLLVGFVVLQVFVKEKR